jgi:glycerol uptake facilitator-like aquaporin
MRLLHSAGLRRVAAEFLGSALLAAVVVGSGIAAGRLSPTDVGLQLMENALATALALPVLILLFIHVSGAHFNPVVSLVDSALASRSWLDTAAYIPAQVLGCITGAMLANLMFGATAVSWSAKERLTGATFLAEAVATAGLVLVIFALARTERASVIPAAVGAYIGAAYFFTSSTSFANPAITVGRMFSDSFAGIAPSSTLGFIAAQLLGGGIGYLLVRYFYPVRHPARVKPVTKSTGVPVE